MFSPLFANYKEKKHQMNEPTNFEHQKKVNVGGKKKSFFNFYYFLRSKISHKNPKTATEKQPQFSKSHLCKIEKNRLAHIQNNYRS